MAAWVAKSWLKIRMNLHFTLILLYLVSIIPHGQSETLINFPLSGLQRHVKVARHLPTCILFRKKEQETKLGERLVDIWRDNSSDHKFTYWQIGQFPMDMVKTSTKNIQLPDATPTLRCFLGQRLPFDYQGSGSIKSLISWFNKLMLQHKDQLQEATKDVVEQSIANNRLTLLGFSDYHQHHELEEMLAEVREDYWGEVKVLFVHPHSPYITDFKAKYDILQLPAVIFFEKPSRNSRTTMTQIQLQGMEMGRKQIDIFLLARSFTAVTLNTINFEEEILSKSRHYTPTLVCFYGWWSPGVTSYLSAFGRTAADMNDLGAHLRFGLFEVNAENQLSLGKFVNARYTQKFPFIMLYKTRFERTTVMGIDQYLLPVDIPTPLSLLDALQSTHTPLQTKQGERLIYQPWGFTHPSLVSLPSEGPYGKMCSKVYHNQTDNDPQPRPVPIWLIRYQNSKIRKPKQVKKENEKEKEVDKGKKQSWHQQFGSEEIDGRLDHVGLLPIVTDAMWAEVIEKSHAPRHPFLPGGKWRGEVTKVALVIFIIADCNSCSRNMKLFEDLYRSASYIEGGSVYLMNCTSDGEMCRQLGVTGYPTLAAFRGLGWLHGENCMSQTSEKMRFVRLDYHGVLLVKPIMAWFSKAAGTAVKNVKWEELDHDEMDEDVRLVGTLLPKKSRFLPRIPAHKRGRDYFYSYQCLRLACERLYGQAPCYTQYSTDVPAAEFRDENDLEEQEMVITRIDLFRGDGQAVTVMRLGEALVTTMEDQSGSSMHSFHKPHRYPIRVNQKCAEDHARCTDFVVEFTRDHGRLPVSQISLHTFHQKNNLVLTEEMPILIALVHQDNITEDAKFYQSVHRAAVELYSEVVVVTVDVDQYPAWAGQFVPTYYRRLAHDLPEGEFPSLYLYPRICMVWWRDHQHAAFYPPLDMPVSRDKPFNFQKKKIVKFAKNFIKDSQSLLVETEHF